MRTFTVQVVNAFVDADTGGNPAGVVLDAERLSLEEKQLIAAGAGFSETVFISPSKLADFKLEFFTPVCQVADCGHATVAAFYYLAQLGKIKGECSSKEVLYGTRDIYFYDDAAYMRQEVPRYTELRSELTDVLNSLAIGPSDLFDELLPVIANNKNNCLIIPLRDQETLRRIIPDFSAIEQISKTLNLIEYYVFSTETQVDGRDAGARMFAPLIGIPEESATGMAAGPLGCYLHDFLGIQKDEMIIEQGHLMRPPSPSEIRVKLSLDGGNIKSLIVGGRAKVMGSLNVEFE